jgi:hypothetical protein
MRRAVSNRRDPPSRSCADAKLSPPATLERKKPKPNQTAWREGKSKRKASGPINATLTGSDCCEALGITARGRAPVLDLCRALVAAGHDPRRPLHAYRGDVLALKVRSIGEGAKLIVKEDRAAPRFVPWEPFPRRVQARARQKAEGIGSALDQADESSALPGAAVRTSAKSLPNSHSGMGRRQ